MAKSFVNTGNTEGKVVVATTGDVVLDGKLYKDGDPVDDWDAAKLSAGAEFSVRTPHTYQVVVNALFKGEGTADVSCTVGAKTKTVPMAGDADDDGIDLEIAQFRIYS
jgi:hypothetical protein